MAIRRDAKIHSSDKFTTTSSDKTIVAEASDLGHNFYSQIYDDTIDQGFQVKSHLTGKLATFTLSHTEVDEDRDIRWWEFVPDMKTQYHLPSLKGWRIIVFND